MVYQLIFSTAPVYRRGYWYLKNVGQNPDGILFIDASKGFEKVKNQNMLREEHIDKIVQTFRDRTAIEKYSYNTSLQEVPDNYYNLNIPRYVDTFEGKVDIKSDAE